MLDLLKFKWTSERVLNADDSLNQHTLQTGCHFAQAPARLPSLY